MRALAAVSLGAAVTALSSQAPQPDAGQVIQMLRARQFQQALASTDHMLVQYPRDCRLLSLRGVALNGMQRPVEAEQAFKQALGYCPDDLMALEGAAEIEYAHREADTSELLQRILNIRPQDETAHAMLASFYRAKGECKAALPHFEASQALFASHPSFQQGYAFCLADTEHYAQAAAAYQAVLASAPDDAARYNLALVQWKLQDPKSALETLRPLLTANAREAVLALGARVAEESGDTSQAVKLLRSGILAKPQDPANYLEFAQISFNHRSFQIGIDMIDAGLRQLPDSAPLYLARGVLEVQLSQSDKAIADFERAHTLAHQSSLAMDAIGIMESQQHKQTAALALFAEQAKLHPNDGLLQYLYAEALSDADPTADSTRKAIQAAERSVAIDPSYGPAHDLLALLWLRTNQPQPALQQAEAALKIQPDDEAALYHEIMARRRLGQTEQVQALVKQLEGLRSQNANKAKQRYILQEEPAH